MLTAAGADEALAVAVVDVAQSAATDHGRELATRADLEHQREAHGADMAALETRLTWRFAGAMLAQILAILGVCSPSCASWSNGTGAGRR